MTQLSPAPIRADLVAAVANWEAVLRSELVERDEEIHLFALALAAREHLFLLGKPGLAKTLTLERGVKYISGVRMFIVQLGQLSTRDETEGPVSLKGLENDEYRRVGRGYSTDCEIVVLDEGFKASKSLLNAQLRLAEERMFNDNGVSKRAPLSTLCLTSNEERSSDEQEAFDDRLLLRKVVDRVRDRANVIRMLRMELVDEPAPIISWDEWTAVQQMVAAMPVADEVFEMVADLEHDLLAGGIEITPRRLRKCKRIIQAEAFLDGADRAEVDHVAVLEYCAWLKSADQPKAQQIVLRRAAPFQQEGLELLADIEKVGVEVEALLGAAAASDDDVDFDAAAALQKKLKQAKRRIEKLEREGGTAKRQRDLLLRIRDRQRTIATRLLVEAFDQSPESIEASLAAGRG